MKFGILGYTCNFGILMFVISIKTIIILGFFLKGPLFFLSN